MTGSPLLAQRTRPFVRITDAYNASPWWPTPGIVPAQVEYIGPWPDGGTGMCVRSFPAATLAESNREAQTFALALQIAADKPVRDAGEWWEIAA